MRLLRRIDLRRSRRAHHGRSTLELATPTKIAALLPIAAKLRPVTTIGSLEARLRLHLRLLDRLRTLRLLRTLELGACFGRAHLALRTVAPLAPLAPIGAVLSTTTLLHTTILRKGRRRDQRRGRHDRGEQSFAHRIVLTLRPDVMSGRWLLLGGSR
ncbi:hypothetical protein HMP06_1306 [Sphingomonas sp. HMP6]|nr:hypothetical protein HMP06_1306 [Sphingomonas sp. HMP6]